MIHVIHGSPTLPSRSGVCTPPVNIYRGGGGGGGNSRPLQHLHISHLIYTLLLICRDVHLHLFMCKEFG